ncbi:chaps family protein [Exidia glandulosa HHB12029]|uniref:Chaps family protein n=1 Tax=Exidia glandulosa HHB12029 TaxID=1314781 RepID=A0A166A1I2_EXIGL|nr:chaps family protein [Exidia glandulosa HHB12029]
MTDVFRDVPEFFEVELGEALAARTETLSTFRELGPPDLCHVVKSSGKTGQKDIGSYHYVSGVDASSSASLAAYINSLTYTLEDNSTWFAKSNAWKVRSGCYCCFNAFSRVDVRVDVKIPGGVHAKVIDLRGEQHECTAEIWQETYLSALLRAILYADDPNYRLVGFRKLDPITTREGELRFLQAAEALFFKGWQLGSDPEIQVASVVSNHLSAGVMKYFGDSFRFDIAANLFEKLYAKDNEVASLLAQCYIGMNEEVKAIQIIASALKETPQSFTLLHVQCDFLRSKGKYDWALKLAREAVNCAPSEFVTWAKLTEVYIDLGMYESALLTLNSCPMFTYNERDLHRMPPPARTHLPVKAFITETGIIDDDELNKEGADAADVALARLPAPNLRGTFAKAYALLARLVSQIGWDELLKSRSAVFVMEEEYRMQKAVVDIRTSLEEAEGEEHEAEHTPHSGEDDAASTRAIRSRPSSPHARTTSEAESDEWQQDDEAKAAAQQPDAETNGVHHDDAEPEDEEVDLATPTPELDKPEMAASPTTNGDAHAGENVEASTAASVEHTEGFSFSNKRLCERWLDNLFMVLYEDLRVWTIFRAEVAHFKTQHVAYRKTGKEWEILGDLGVRLHHKEEAKEAYQRCLESRFSSKAWTRLLEIYADESDLQKTLNAAIRLAAYQHRWYMETVYPSEVAKQLFKLGQTYGHDKISFTLLSMGLPQPIQNIMKGYTKYGETFKVEGHDF